MALSPTQRTLKFIRDAGYMAGIVERWLPNPAYPGGGKRKDYLNIIDIIALKGNITLGVQSTGQDVSGHIKKILNEHPESALEWLSGRDRQLFIVGWRKVLKKRGGKARVWKPRIVKFFVEGKELRCVELESKK